MNHLIKKLVALRDEALAIHDELMSLPRPPVEGDAERWDATLEYANKRLIEIKNEANEIKAKLEEIRRN